VWLGVLAVLIVAAAAFGVAGLIGGSSGSGSADPTAGLAATTAGAAPRPVSWLGMEILTVPPGVAVIDTVGLNSPAARAGLEPGEQIVQVNNRRIGGAGDIAAAIRGLHAGDTVQIQASNGAASYATGITLAAPPTPYP
jgi:serine protease Do